MNSDKKYLLALSFLLIFIAGCKPSFIDISNEMKHSNILLPENKHDYSATWLSDSTIVFSKSLGFEDFNHDFLVNPKSIVVLGEIYSYDISTNTWKKILLGQLDCHLQEIGTLERLPNGLLGLVQSCREGNDVLRQLDINSNNSKILFRNGEFPNWDVGLIWTYAFSPKMTEWIQEDASGRFLNNQLYYIKQDEEPVQIVPDFIRAMSPAWSPYNREIAFWGTENYRGSNKPEIKYTWDLIGLVDAPWNLYMSSPEGKNVHPVLLSIKNPGDISWSPTKNVIAFSGEYKRVEGLWLFDPISLELTRIWNKRGIFSWSPDGKKIIISYIKYGEDYLAIEEQSIDIIHLPDY